jgi:hypothetical protein
MNPFHFRPDNDDRVDTSQDDATDWEDNALSNTLAWASWRFVPRWCEQKDHPTTRLADALFTTCPCCMMYRGIGVGVLGTLASVLVAFVIVHIVRALS